MKKRTKLKIIRWIIKLLRYDTTKDFSPIIVNTANIAVLRCEKVMDYKVMVELRKAGVLEKEYEIMERQSMIEIMDHIIKNNVANTQWKHTLDGMVMRVELMCLNHPKNKEQWRQDTPTQ